MQTFLGQQVTVIDPQHTDILWRISQSFEGKSKERIRTDHAIQKLREILNAYPQSSMIWEKAYKLQKAIIYQEHALQSPELGATPATVLAFPTNRQ